MRIFAVEFPPPEFIIFAVFLLIGLIGKIVDFARKVRQRSLEQQQQRERGLGPEPRPEPVAEPEPEPRVELPPRPAEEAPPVLELPFRLMPVRRPPRPRREVVKPPKPRPFVPAVPVLSRRPAAPARRVHPAVRLLRSGPGNLRQAILLAEILGPPKARRRARMW